MMKYGIHYILVDNSNIQFKNILSVLNIENEKYFRFINMGDVLHPQTLEFEINIIKKYRDKIDLIYHDYITFKNELPNFNLNKNNIKLINTKYILSNLNNIIESQIAFVIKKDFIKIINSIDKNKFISFNEILYYFFHLIGIKKCNIVKVDAKYIGVNL